jgi:3-methyladenine DNA glycosylase AlkD
MIRPMPVSLIAWVETMTKSEVLALLKKNRNERGIEHWEKLGPETGKLKSFGTGLTQLRKLAKQIGRDHKLALQLWKSDVYDAKIIGLLIDDPKQLPERRQARFLFSAGSFWCTLLNGRLETSQFDATIRRRH